MPSNPGVGPSPSVPEKSTYLLRRTTGAYTTGKITEEQRLDVVRHACPGVGACGGMYTCVANRPIPVDMLQRRDLCLQCEYDERMHGGPRHVPTIFIEYSCSLSGWELQ